jgi:hypothetical protein
MRRDSILTRLVVLFVFGSLPVLLTGMYSPTALGAEEVRADSDISLLKVPEGPVEAQNALQNARQLLNKYQAARSGSPAMTAAYDKAVSAFKQLVESYPDTTAEAKGLIVLYSLYQIQGDLKNASKVII